MLHQKSVSPALRTLPPFSLRRQRRAVLVQVRVHGRVVDSFEIAHPQTLRAALRPVYSFLPIANGTVHFRAVDESWLPLGLGFRRDEADLNGLSDALEHLAA